MKQMQLFTGVKISRKEIHATAAEITRQMLRGNFIDDTPQNCEDVKRIIISGIAQLVIDGDDFFK